jgi:hypothetical protein
MADTDKHHDEQEWEEQRQAFTKYYMTENKSLKEAASIMKEKHNFFATPRQWERRIKNWQLNKYVSRDQRLEQFRAEGRDLVEVASSGGRRQRKYSHGKHLPVQDDRNVRRFAKRELDRSRSTSRNRSRSPSVGHASRGSSPGLDFSGDEAVVAERTYNVDFSALSRNEDLLSIPVEETYHTSDDPHVQAHVLQTQDLNNGSQHSEVLLSAPNLTPDQLFPTADQFDAFTPMPSMDTNIGSPMPPTFYHQPSLDTMDLSPTNGDSQTGGWNSPHDLHLQDTHSSFGTDLGLIQSNTMPNQGPMDIMQNGFQQDTGFSMSSMPIIQVVEPPPDPGPMLPDTFDSSVPVDFSMILSEYTEGIQQALSLTSLDQETRYKLEICRAWSL